MAHRAVLTARQRAALFDLPTDEVSLLRHYTLADDDIAHIRTRRRPENQIGFALQLCAFRFPGRLPKAGEVIPEPVSRFIAAQLGLRPDDLLQYAAREKTRREHLGSLRKMYGYKMFAGKLNNLLNEEADSRTSRFIWLRQFEVGKNSADINRQLDRLGFLQGVALSATVLDDIPAHRVARLRRQGERYFTDGLLDITSDRRLAILAVCVVEWAAAIADTVVETHDRIVGSIWRDAKRICDTRVSEAQAEIETTLAGFETLGTTLLMAKGDEAAIAGAVDASCGWGVLESLVVNAGELRKTVKADALTHVEKGYHKFKLYAPRMLAALDKVHIYAKVIREMNFGNGRDDAIMHVDRKHLNNRIEGDHGASKQLPGPKRGADICPPQRIL